MGLTDILRSADPTELEALATDVYTLTEQLVSEIKMQQILAAAESGELEVRPMLVDSLEMLRTVFLLYNNHESAKGLTLVMDPTCTSLPFFTDASLLRRVLGNMVKNALEASEAGQTVTLSCQPRDNGIEFSVHNVGFMPRATQLQIFQRSFSSKGSGRGLGTFSMKLLTERYLQGSITFTSIPDSGTTFTVWYPLAPVTA